MNAVAADGPLEREAAPVRAHTVARLQGLPEVVVAAHCDQIRAGPMPDRVLNGLLAKMATLSDAEWARERSAPAEPTPEWFVEMADRCAEAVEAGVDLLLSTTDMAVLRRAVAAYLARGLGRKRATT